MCEPNYIVFDFETKYDFFFFFFLVLRIRKHPDHLASFHVNRGLKYRNLYPRYHVLHNMEIYGVLITHYHTHVASSMRNSSRVIEISGTKRTLIFRKRELLPTSAVKDPEGPRSWNVAS
jgi:hypothetical protein